MRKLAYAALALLGLGALLLALTPFLIRRYLPPEKLRALVVERAEAALGRKVRLSAVSIGALKGLSLEGLAVSERPDFEAGTFAEAAAFRLRVRLAPLLRKQLVVDSVSLDGLSLALVRRADGSFNFSDIAGSTAAAAGAASPSADGAQVALAVRRASIAGARVDYRDAAGTQLTVSELHAKISDFRLDGPFGAELALKASGRAQNQPIEGALAFEGKINLGGYDPSKASLEIKKLLVERGGWRAGVSGTAKGLKAPELDLELSLAAGGREALSGSFRGAVAGGAPPAAHGRLALKSGGLNSGELKTLGLDTRAALPPMELEADFALAEDALTLKDAVVSGAAGRLKLSGKIAGVSGKAPQPELTAAADLNLPSIKAGDLPVSGWPAGLVTPPAKLVFNGAIAGRSVKIDLLRLEPPKGRLEASGSVSEAWGGAKPSWDLKISADLDLPTLKPGDLPIPSWPAGLVTPAAHLVFKGNIDTKIARIERLLLEPRQGKIEAAGTIRNFAAKPEWDLAVSADLALPAFKGAEAPYLKLPAGFWSPEMRLAAAATSKGEELAIERLKIETKAGIVQAKGRVSRLLSKPEPELTVSAALSLPAWATADLAWAGAPGGWTIPPTKWNGEITALRDELKIKTLRLIAGKNDVEIDGGRVVGLKSGNPLFNLLIKTRSFSLDELATLSAELQQMKLTGGGFFALGVTGRLPRPLLEGKLQFKALGATIAGLKLADFNGTASFDERRIDLPKLVGKVGDGELDLNLTVKNYSTAPLLEVEASLTEFDLGKFLAAKASMEKPAPAPAAAPTGAPKAAPAPLATKGRFNVARLLHPNAEVKDVRLNWDLEGITPELKGLAGFAKLVTAGGRVTRLTSVAIKSKFTKVLMLPLRLLTVLPNLNEFNVTEIVGDYAFQDGLMTLRESRLDSDAALVTGTGTVDLPSEKLSLTVTTQVGRLAPLDVACRGTFDEPQCKAKVMKFIAEPAKQLIDLLKKK